MLLHPCHRQRLTLHPFPTRRSSDLTGLTIALMFGSLLVVVGAFMSVCGGIVAAVGIEATLLREGAGAADVSANSRSEEHTSELQSRENLVCRVLLEKKKKPTPTETA